MNDQELDRLARQMLKALASEGPPPDTQAALRRFKARVRRERYRTAARWIGMAATALVVLVASLTAVKPSYAHFSWQQMLMRLGSKVGVITRTSQPQGSLPKDQPSVDLSVLARDLPFGPRLPGWQPEGFSLVKGTVKPLTQSTATLILSYENSEKQSFVIKETNSTATTSGTDGFNSDAVVSEKVKLGTVEGILLTFKANDSRMLLFPSEGMQVSIEGNLTPSDMIKIASSMVK